MRNTPGGQLGETVIRESEWLVELLNELSDRLEFVAKGLSADDPCINGATMICWDMVRTIEDKLHGEGSKDLPAMARELAEIAEGQAPLLPETHQEVKLFEALKKARAYRLTARNFMCDAALEAYKRFKEQYAEPYPGEETVAAVVGQVEARAETPEETRC